MLATTARIRRAWIVLNTVVLLVSVGVIVVSDVVAHNYPEDGLFPDSGSHIACWVPNPNTTTIPSDLWDHLFSYMDVTLKNQTGMDVSWTTNCNNTADMRLDNRLDDGINYGVQWCINSNGNICNGSNINIDPVSIDNDAPFFGTSSYGARRMVWCHETGHSIGFMHNGQCMSTAGLYGWHDYSAHDVQHLNAQF